ncbi:MAG: PAS domain-containing protein [Armatimonadetes bacterium]|nr:PAS domain-containing protein [Armatimonadota bacterium]
MDELPTELLNEPAAAGFAADILESIPDGFVALDREWRCTHINRQAAAILRRAGRTPEDLLGRSIWEAFPGLTQTRLGPECRRALRDQVRAELEEYYPRLDAWLEIRACPSERGLLVYFRDITARRRVEEERERLAEYSRLLLESTGEGVYGLDGRGRCTFVNQAGARMLGYAPDDLLGRDMHALTHHTRPDGSPYPASECPIYRAFETGFACRVDDELFWHRDGIPFPVAYSSFPLIQIVAGEPVLGAVVAFTDITRRKQEEDELRRARDAAEAADRAKSWYLATISHDLRTPLTSLLSGLQALPLAGELNEAQQEMLDIALNGGRTLLGMINDLLDVEKMGQGVVLLELEPLSASELVAQSIAQVALLARSAGLTLAQEVAPNQPAFEGDADKLRRTLVNLLGNAIKFTSPGGTVTVIARPGDDGDSLFFAVRDTGDGIPPEDFGRIFEMFGQAESGRRDRRQGTGLGLTFCKLAVEAHGGRIWVESTVGVGSTFCFTLPLRRA